MRWEIDCGSCGRRSVVSAVIHLSTATYSRELEGSWCRGCWTITERCFREAGATIEITEDDR